MRSGTQRLLTATVLVAGLLSCSARALAKDAPKAAPAVRAVVLTGGHGFDAKAFGKLFAGHADVAVDIVGLKDHSEIFEDISKWDYHVIVMYNMTQKISPKRQKNFLALLDRGVGLIVLHHAFGAYQAWDEFRKIAGVRFVLKQTVVDGKTYRPSGYKHDVEIRVKVAPVPYSRDARESYAAGWRTRQVA